jgi:UDP-3-O-[3-hydroxymyristoyl] glucosamine N-acyltransferase
MTTSYSSQGPFNLLQLESISGAKAIASSEQLATLTIQNISNVETAKKHDLCVLHNKKYLRALEKSDAGACIIHESLARYVPESMAYLIHPNPYKGFALIAQAFYPKALRSAYRSPQAFVANSAIIGENCVIEFGSYVGEGAVIGDRTIIGAQAYVGDGVVIGKDCVISNQSSISNTIMGDRVVIQPGARIGQDGFGFASDAKGHYKIPHIGKVILGNDVSIGANTCVDRGTLGNTVIADHCRLDNLVQIGHNVSVDFGTIMAGQCGIAGSSNIGKFVKLAGQVGVSGHLTIKDHATIFGKSAVVKDVPEYDVQWGVPSAPYKTLEDKKQFMKKHSQKA